MEGSIFWNVQLPTNLKKFIGSAQLHRQQVKQFRDSENEKSLLSHKLDKWINDLEKVLALLEQWHSTLNAGKESRRMSILRRECFPFFREFLFDNHAQLHVINLDGESVKFPADVNVLLLEQKGPSEFVWKVEEAIHRIISENYEKHSENRDLHKLDYKVSKQLDDYVHKSSFVSACKHIADHQPQLNHTNFWLELKGTAQRVELRLDFVPHVPTLSIIDASFSTNWAAGKIPIFCGNMQHCRWRVRSLSSILFSSIHYINCHHFLKQEVFETIIQASQQNSVLMIFEHFDQLHSNAMDALFAQFEGINRGECFLTSKL
uniref:Uncharacterized protein n=1 Tax=Ditylenchus dipsaci TaxID=166011 RepID=A0A915EH44_9BILA